MKPVTVVALIVSAAMAAACAGDTRESLAAESQRVLDEFAATLDGIKDADTARSAKPKLQAIIKRMDDINTRQNKLPAQTNAETKALVDKYGKKMEETAAKVQAAMMRIFFTPAIQAELKDIDFQKIGR